MAEHRELAQVLNALGKQPENEALLVRAGMLLTQIGEPLQAARIFERLGSQVWEGGGNPLKAVAWLKHAATLAPADPQVREKLAQAHRELGLEPDLGEGLRRAAEG